MTLRKQGKTETIRVGVIGIGQGQAFAKGATAQVGMELVALCDTWEERLREIGKLHKVTTYTDYDRFLEHDMDAVILANYFHEHAPFAIKALRAGKHVMSECICNSTLAEGVELCRAVEKSGLTYMLGENYPYTAFNMEMRRVYNTGEIGRVTYAEGEYNHPIAPDARIRMSPGVNHWRNWIPSTYYCTHALAPLVYITGARPVKVNGLSISCPSVDKLTVRRGDAGSVILCRMDNGAVFRIFGLLLPGHSNWYRIHGDRGAMEITRGPGYFGPGQVRIWHEEWNIKPGELRERTYLPDWPKHGNLARQTGHGGGDFWPNFEFANAIRAKKPPFLDVYRGVTMSSVGILAWKSALADGTPFAVPDFSKEADRVKYQDDNWSPFPSHAKQGYKSLPPNILGNANATKAGMAAAKRIWKETDYQNK
ncbi:MAG: Gfo/Idh/MocA family oxidoreductase [Candidatus Latescibacterota bacterium]